MGKSIALSAELHEYALAHSSAPNDEQRRLAAATRGLGDISIMQLSHDVAELLTSLVSLLAPRLVIEIGTFTGYSTLAMAKALPDDGRIIACDVSEEWTAIARRHWALAGVDDQIDLRIAPAIETLGAMPDGTTVDMAFIDADKTSYLDYYETLLPMLSDRGVILVDNTLWFGQVLDPEDTSADTVALRAFNDRVVADDRVRVVLLSIGDGLTLIHRA